MSEVMIRVHANRKQRRHGKNCALLNTTFSPNANGISISRQSANKVTVSRLPAARLHARADRAGKVNESGTHRASNKAQRHLAARAGLQRMAMLDNLYVTHDIQREKLIRER